MFCSSDVCIEDDIMTIVSCFVVNFVLSIVTPLYMVGSVRDNQIFQKKCLPYRDQKETKKEAHKR